MAFPTSTDYPGSLDTLEDRTDNVDVIWANDFDYQAKQIRGIQSFLGESGKLIGENISGSGLAGMLSPVADGGTAFKLAARNDFTSGTLLTVGDDQDSSYQEKFRVNYDGLVWSNGGADFSGGILDIPVGSSLPGAGTNGRLFFKTGSGEGLYSYGSSGWLISGSTKNIRGHSIVVGNSLEGDTADDCDYLDSGNGAQLQAALTAAAANDVDVLIRRGTYDLGSGGSPTYFNIPAGVRAVGVGSGLGQTVLKSRAAGGDGRVAYLNQGSRLESARVFGTIPTAAQSDGDGLVELRGADSVLKEVILEFENSWATIGDVTYPWLYAGVSVDATSDVRLVDVTVKNAPKLQDSGGGFMQCVYIYDTDRVHIRGLETTGGEYGLWMANSNNCHIRDFTFNEWRDYGLYAQFCLNSRYSGFFVASDGVAPTTAIGVQLREATHVSVHDGYFSGGGDVGMKILQSSDNNVFGALRGDGLWDNTAFLTIASGCDNNIVTGCQFNGDGYTDAGTGNDFAHNRA